MASLIEHFVAKHSEAHIRTMMFLVMDRPMNSTCHSESSLYPQLTALPKCRSFEEGALQILAQL